MLNIVIPMAGAGSRFVAAGYVEPKPLIPLHGIPMIRWVIENLRPKEEHRFIFICQSPVIQSYDLNVKLRRWTPGSMLIALQGLTDGAACTVLQAKALINNENELMIANSDQYIDADIDSYLRAMRGGKLDGQIMTMKASDPKWSYVEVSKDNYVRKVVEKVVISDEATTGIYNFKRGCDFVRAAEAMIQQGLRVGGEFYVAPAYNQLIRDGLKIGYFNVGRENNGMHGLGTPGDLNYFASLDISRRVAAGMPCEY